MRVRLPFSQLGDFSGVVLNLKPGESTEFPPDVLCGVFPLISALNKPSMPGVISPERLLIDAGNAILRKALGPRTRLSADLVLTAPNGRALRITRLKTPLTLPRAGWINPAFAQGWAPEPRGLGGWFQTGEIGLAAQRLKAWHEKATKEMAKIAEKRRQKRKNQKIKTG